MLTLTTLNHQFILHPSEPPVQLMPTNIAGVLFPSDHIAAEVTPTAFASFSMPRSTQLLVPYLGVVVLFPRPSPLVTECRNPTRNTTEAPYKFRYTNIAVKGLSITFIFCPKRTSPANIQPVRSSKQSQLNYRTSIRTAPAAGSSPFST